MNPQLLDAYLAGELDPPDRSRVERALRQDPGLLEQFAEQARMDAALRALLAPESDLRRRELHQGVLARLRSEGASERGFAKSVLLEIVEEREAKHSIRWSDLVKTGLISAAASIGLLLLAQSVVFHKAEHRSAASGRVAPVPAFVARVERSEGLQWDAASRDRVRSDGWLSSGFLRLEAGTALIAFNSGAAVLVEGPAELSIESVNRMFLKSGRLTAEVPPRASGFTVNTPRLNAVDIGTRFGLSVDRDGDSELHVMQGEVEASRTSGNAVAIRVREGLAVRADSRTRTGLEPVSYQGDTFRHQVGTPPHSVPALRFDFDESSGPTLEDSGSAGAFDVPLVATGELDRSPRRSAGRFGGGLVFEPGETLDVPLSREFRLEEAHTIGFWAKIPAKIGRTGERTILSYGREGLAWRVSCNLDPRFGNRGALRIGCGDGCFVGTADLADGNWHHVVYRFLGGGGDLAANLHLFVDGKLEPVSYFRPATPPTGRVGNLRVGGGEADGFLGWIDDLVVYREAIATPELQALGDGPKRGGQL